MLALLLLLPACRHVERADGDGAKEILTRERASAMVRSLFASYGVESPGLNANDLGAGTIGDAALYFEYGPGEKSLICSALVYKFHDDPRPGVLDAFYAEESTTSTGGGHLVYEDASKGLYLDRIYKSSRPDSTFRADMEELARAGVMWGNDVLPGVAEKVFHPK
ncbi:MAG: hypothetical protein JWQ98_633 [Chlorobi bacterium]|nr:hypothetical protein [Chlorobiota bacterium]